ncbi:MAG: hypothetical protein COA52_01340 [Hyphomicrobiales bacterium]|nr:MAG: hypothetical protein COA52_00250 [Hyphomicrobiales bacterium]PCJ96876.1 MAG: hypothetical protein COA52_01340 [Hyphomicrobiales bacterium]
MKLSKKTLEILTSFTTINKSIWIESGNVIKTKPELGNSPTCIATVEEDFTVDFGIYELQKLLQLIKLFDDPEIEFYEAHLAISDSSGKRATFRYDSEEHISHPNYAKSFKLPSTEIETKVSSGDIKTIVKSAKALGKPNITFRGDGNDLFLTTYDIKLTKKAQKKQDEFTIKIGETDRIFNMIFDINDLLLISGDYNVSLCFKGLAKFESENVTYFVSPEGKSTYDEE